jgi:riboflavin synthase
MRVVPVRAREGPRTCQSNAFLPRMFTGITRGTFEVVSATLQNGCLDYWVDLKELSRNLELGASVAIDGVCQTVAALDGSRVLFQAIEETLAVTTLGSLLPGSRVSAERSLRAGDEIGGHDVAGHVTGTGEIVEVTARPGVHNLLIAVPEKWRPFLLPKGFVAVDGSSLTIGETSADGFRVHLIPETLRLTNLGSKRIGDRVNIELDPRTVAIVTTVERYMKERPNDGERFGRS